MPRISLPPFLKKLQAVCAEVDEKIASWSEDGDSFIVHSSTGFEKYLGNFFKGSLLTFIRQLHFYGFRKVDIKGEKWSFSHKCFRRGHPHLVYEIRRKTRTETNDGIASQLEVQALRDHVGSLHELINQLQKEMKEVKAELQEIRSTSGTKRSAEQKVDTGKGKKVKYAAGFEPKKSEQAQFDTLAGIFDGEGFFGDGFDLLPFSDSSLEKIGEQTMLPFTDASIQKAGGQC